MFFQNINFISEPTKKEKVIFQCDEYYFENFAFYNLLSCNNVGHDVHIHFINPSTEFLEKVKKIDLDIELSITSETFSVENINYYKLKSYYFCSRYFITDFLFSNRLIEKAYITDADIIFNEKISFEEKIQLAVLYYPNYDNLWKQTGANFLYVTQERSDFVKKVVDLYCNKIKEIDFDSIHGDMDKYTRSNMYGLDQVCMSLQMQNENIIDQSFLNLITVDNFLSKKEDTKIWTFTGGNTKSNPELKQILFKKFKKSF